MSWDDVTTEMQLKQEQAYMQTPGGSPQRMSRRQQLEFRRRRIESDLAAVNKALAALDAHPELEEFIETLAQAGA